MNKDKWLWLAGGVVGIAVAYVAYTMYGKTAPQEGANIPPGVACTMEAKLCPDGSYVGRQGPKCEFAPCPGPAVNVQVK